VPDQPYGCFCLVLHGHIPYGLGHGTWPHGSEMVYEAAADTYMPLIRVCDELAADGISAKFTLSLSPVTLDQLADDRFKDWFGGYLEQKRQTAEENYHEFEWRHEGHLQHLAWVWQKHYEGLQRDFHETYGRDLVAQFRRLQDAGHIELMTCAATHGYLPLLREDTCIQAQVKQAVQTYEQHLGRRPRGLWLPECAYRPRTDWGQPPEIEGDQHELWRRKGIEEFLSENGFDYFIVDTHMIAGGHALPVAVSFEDSLGKLWGQIRRMREPVGYDATKNPHQPCFVGGSFEDHPPVACFVRDPSTSLQVWSGRHGYPGDSWYLDFHKRHLPARHRYWRITDDSGDLARKQPYEPEQAANRWRDNAGHFLWLTKAILEHAPRPGGRLPVLCAPFDAELFGHWWFEGPHWLKQTLQWMHQDPGVEVCTCHEYLERFPPHGAIALPEGSWGAGGGHYIWLNPDTAWTWRRIYDAERDMSALAREWGATQDETLRKLVQQAARELLLLEASDWQFLITTWSARDYAEHRVQSHHTDFKRVAELARKYGRHETLTPEDWAYFGDLCHRDHLFPNVDPQWWRSVEYSAI